MHTRSATLITIWDGTPEGCGEVRCFYESLLFSKSVSSFEQFVLLGPDCVTAKPILSVVDQIKEKLNLSLAIMPFAFTGDRYWGKSILGTYVSSRDVTHSDLIVYLDADHIFFRSFDLPHANEQSIYLSSEFTSSIPLKAEIQAPQDIIPQDHFNTSMILGTKTALTPS